MMAKGASFVSANGPPWRSVTPLSGSGSRRGWDRAQAGRRASDGSLILRKVLSKNPQHILTANRDKAPLHTEHEPGMSAPQEPLHCPCRGEKIVPYPSRFFWLVYKSDWRETDWQEHLLHPRGRCRNSGQLDRAARPPPKHPLQLKTKEGAAGGVGEASAVAEVGGDQEKHRKPGHAVTSGPGPVTQFLETETSSLPDTVRGHPAQVATSLTHTNDLSRGHAPGPPQFSHGGCFWKQTG